MTGIPSLIGYASLAARETSSCIFCIIFKAGFRERTNKHFQQFGDQELVVLPLVAPIY